MSYTFQKNVRGRSNTWKKLQKRLATILAKLLQRPATSERTLTATRTRSEGMSLHNKDGRKYLNTDQRRRFMCVLEQSLIEVRLFCLTLMWSGCRISEALALTPSSFDIDTGTVEIETLKRRRRGLMRQVPLPSSLLEELKNVFNLRAAQRDPARALRRLWPWSRSTAWRYVKAIMRAANIYGGAAMPKGLRHTFGIAAFHVAPPHLVQRWLGHASLRTTAIYGDVSGPDERNFAERIWQTW